MNVGGEKIYAPLYRDFKHRISVPQVYIDEMYTSRYARYFYSQEELERFGRKWGGGI